MGVKLRELRVANHLTIDELAEKMKLTPGLAYPNSICGLRFTISMSALLIETHNNRHVIKILGTFEILISFLQMRL